MAIAQFVQAQSEKMALVILSATAVLQAGDDIDRVVEFCDIISAAVRQGDEGMAEVGKLVVGLVGLEDMNLATAMVSLISIGSSYEED